MVSGQSLWFQDRKWYQDKIVVSRQVVVSSLICGFKTEFGLPGVDVYEAGS